MNHTNRFLNRALLLLIGLIFLVLGAGVVAVFAWPAAAQWWSAASASAQAWVDDAIRGTMVGESALSWVSVGSLAAIVLLIVLLIIVMARLGGGHTHSLVRTGGQDSPAGRIIIDTGFISDALRQSLDHRPEILFSRVSVANIRRVPMMHLSVTPRQSTSPRQITDDVDHLLDNLAALTGADIPSYVSIHTGLRSKLAHDQRRIT
ncbi:hypothetical protein [Cryobacterium psychrophilum]|uniref:Alkaline shock response membrane anchor protein AmaP n=1 Tax=Cryobacterium psychrophilum TaxID=41988 RepID=A0A4Y8KSP5_9MICO|nr:hypothetical protein [Cryobacterium psychrophilum]TDW29632.1 hypothetical protein EDD25_1342 [Cryobacterium psychrophilum]TFD81754.1 hypothetical protein E3T53_01785 [Cryobacterium psychrophilum]